MTPNRSNSINLNRTKILQMRATILQLDRLIHWSLGNVLGCKNKFLK